MNKKSKKPYNWKDRNPALDKKWQVGDYDIKVAHHPGYYLGDWECTIKHGPSKREAHTANNDWKVALVDAELLIAKKIKARRDGKLYMALDRLLGKLKHHFFCAFFHRKGRCYPGVERNSFTIWHCDLCVPCNAAIAVMMDEPVQGAWGQWYLDTCLDLRMKRGQESVSS